MHTHTLQALPENYREILHLDLQQDKKTALRVNVLGIVLAIVFGVIFHLVVPVSSFFDREAGLAAYFVRLLVLLAGYIGYVILQELTHAAAMRFFGGGKVRFGFTGMYACAGSETDYFDRFAYRIIALAPLAVWGVIFTLVMALVPRGWFWVAAFLQLGNISGAAGDIYVAWKLQTVPADALIRDTGVAMWMYSAEGNGQGTGA